MTRKLIVTGCARSGTTLLHTLMPRLEEVKVYRYAETLPARFDRVNLDQIRKRYTVIKRPQLHPEDPRHFLLAELLASGYRVINLIRDGRDVLVSRHPDNPERYWVEPERWCSAIEETLENAAHPDLLIIAYEDLVRHPEATLGRIAEFLGVRLKKGPAGKAEGGFPARPDARAYLQAATIQGVRAISTDSIGNWRRPEHAARLVDLQRLAGERLNRLLTKLGYPL